MPGDAPTGHTAVSDLHAKVTAKAARELAEKYYTSHVGFYARRR